MNSQIFHIGKRSLSNLSDLIRSLTGLTNEGDKPC